ncbi:MAG: hypothetical protein ACT6FE_05170 [Methanosarcinaceae archaeon]
MRKLIITLVLTAFIVTLSSPILYAAQWDSANGPNWVDQAYVDRADVSGDDGGWGDVDSPIPNNNVIFSTFYAKYNRFFIFLITPFIINEETEQQENDNTNNE